MPNSPGHTTTVPFAQTVVYNGQAAIRVMFETTSGSTAAVAPNESAALQLAQNLPAFAARKAANDYLVITVMDPKAGIAVTTALAMFEDRAATKPSAVVLNSL